MTVTCLSRSLDCLYGLAIGDALGASVEFMPHREILAKHGPDGVIDFEPWGGFPRGSITDDTQMSLATAYGLIRARAAGRLDDPIPFIYDRYITWLWSQEDPFHQRAPGRTCISALRSGVCGTVEQPINSSKGVGGAMRIAVIGFVYDPDQAFEIGVNAAAITHGHPSGYLSAGFLASLVSEINSGTDLIDAIERTIMRLQRWTGHEETLGKLWQALDLVGTTIPAHDCIHAIGGGWVGEEALAISLFCALRFPDYKSSVLGAVNHSGDSDSTGSICGSIMGTLLGIDAIPATWVQRIEGSASLRTVAEELVESRSSYSATEKRASVTTPLDDGGIGILRSRT